MSPPPSPVSLVAIVRELSGRFSDCELSHLERQPIDLDEARREHDAYRRTLVRLGCRVQALDAQPALPDSVFVEDTAVVLDELALITRPGAPSRRAETDSIAAVLGRFRPLARIEPPATLDGGDVLCDGRSIWVGLSRRSNRAGLRQLTAHLEPLGYSITGVAVDRCLHLKSAVSRLAPGRLLINPEWVDPKPFGDRELIAVDPGEPFAANALAVGQAVIYPAAFAGTRRRLEQAGLEVVPVEAVEIAKAEGGVSCCSLLFRA